MMKISMNGEVIMIIPEDTDEDTDSTSGYLSEKARDDFLRYIISGLEKADKKNKVFSALIITNLIFSVIQILLLLLT